MVLNIFFKLIDNKRAKGIEPLSTTWKAVNLPLIYARALSNSSIIYGR